MSCAARMSNLCRQQGFTFVEIIFVVVILGSVAAIGSSYLVSTVNAYRDTQVRSVLVQRGRLAVEQIARQIRMAAPNSVRVSSSGACIEFLPVVAGAHYQGALPDANNGMAAVTSISTSEFSLGEGVPAQLVLAPFVPSDVYTNAAFASRVGLGALGSAPITSIPLATSHRFLRNSPTNRVYLTANPLRFCLVGTNLYQYSGYGFLTSALTDTDPGGTTDILAQGISSGSQLFSLSPGSEDRNAAVILDLVATYGRNSLAFTHKALIRNVP